MIKIKQAVIVEGKYDKIKLDSIIDAVIIETNGFGVFKDKETQTLIRKLASTCGILVFTDSDSAGFKIRSFIGGSVAPDSIRHAYIPDIFGKERRKQTPSKEGKLGVEGVPVSVILDALTRAGVVWEEVAQSRRKITAGDLYEDGLSGKKNSRVLRAKVLKSLNLPQRHSTSALIQIMNAIMTFEEYKQVVAELSFGGGETI